MNRLFARKFALSSYGRRKLGRAFSNGTTNETSDPIPSQSKHEQEGNGTRSSSESSHQHDIAIVGGSMVGMSLACSLASNPLTRHLKVAIIDNNPLLGKEFSTKKDDPPDPRVSTVTPATIKFFEDIGAWQHVKQHRHAYFDKMQVWDYTGLGYTRYNAKDVNKEVLGCVLENRVLLSSLLSHVQESDLQKTIYPSRLTSMVVLPSSSIINVGTSPSTDFVNQGRLAKLELSDGNSLYAKLVVGADGSKSRVRELAKLKTTGWNYSQNAIICTVEHSMENFCAWQRFLPSGPIALLPTGDKYSNIVWTMNPKESSDHKMMTDEDFIKTINEALDYGYGPHPKSSFMDDRNMFSWLPFSINFSAHENFEVPPEVVKLASERMVFPLSLMHANEYTSRRVALIGDAAHAVHPLAGQGVNLGFGDASVLSKVIAEGVALGTDIGDVSLLRKYELERKPANIAMMAVLDGFQKAYRLDFAPLNMLRAAAFHGTHYISPLKKRIISFASGEQKLPLFF